MGMRHKVFLDQRQKDVYSCRKCGTHLATHDQMKSTACGSPFPLASPPHRSTLDFITAPSLMGLHLPDLASVNVYEGDPKERNMLTGRHVVRDLSCMGCMAYVGWTYVKAYARSERYKEGLVILEVSILDRPRK
ncbi:hypothetical protein IWQ60_002376 [Tieghemiomyces parasiticus]|uniref:Protein yippee-like n=1 Tax=Tieghemiomyces parasiticus TaxID=78921 RepID=A0A9W8DXF5_9FUNG|nr:hypothetical protein IWQ60_002376 [Tieghemiomyces parasiticus]